MKAISLWQPWASAMTLGSKRIETRHWPTNVRGTVAIHAARRCVKEELNFLGAHWNWCGALNIRMGGDSARLWSILPFGAIVGVGDLVDCRPSESFTNGELDAPRWPGGDKSYFWTERDMGNYDRGRFGWVFENLLRFKTPIPFKGKQGFFNVPDELFEGVEYA
ncbi:MAG: hypothetical protein AB7P97_21460 [Hyphomonadaceae bacterium]